MHLFKKLQAICEISSLNFVSDTDSSTKLVGELTKRLVGSWATVKTWEA